ncbi:MAG: low temperature requirement protein A [Actinomycetia bacterium]|nr:low temperature requirement protein A [Actinomycetes bacterium]
MRTAASEGEGEHRSATWLELFYDLVFVVAVAALGHRLLLDHSWRGVWIFAGLFVPLWWTWASFTFYADRYDTDDLGQRLLAVAQMVAIALMAASISGEESDSTVAFAASFILARAVLLAMYARAYQYIPESRTLVAGYLRGFTLGGIPWVMSLWVPEPWRFVLWGIGLAIDFATPFILRKVQARVPLSVSHLPERFGLFTILVLGESIAAVVAGLGSIGWETDGTIGLILGVVTATGLWWLYFDNVEGSVVRRRMEQTKAWKPTVWIYTHLPLAIGLTASGIGMEFLVAQHGEELRWIAVGGIAVALVSMAIIHLATERGDPRRDTALISVRIVGAFVVIVIGLVSASWATNIILLMLALTCAVQVAIDLVLSNPVSDAQEAA